MVLHKLKNTKHSCQSAMKVNSRPKKGNSTTVTGIILSQQRKARVMLCNYLNFAKEAKWHLSFQTLTFRAHRIAICRMAMVILAGHAELTRLCHSASTAKHYHTEQRMRNNYCSLEWRMKGN